LYLKLKELIYNPVNLIDRIFYIIKTNFKEEDIYEHQSENN